VLWKFIWVPESRLRQRKKRAPLRFGGGKRRIQKLAGYREGKKKLRVGSLLHKKHLYSYFFLSFFLSFSQIWFRFPASLE
jgi:hypothetical protein